MGKPTVADNKPIPADLKEGEEYYCCSCGKSANQPFCDGSHKGTGFAPKAFVAEDSGEGGMLPDEQEANRRYFCELASARFGHLPGNKNTGRISEVRGIPEGQPAVSPPTFSDLNTVDDLASWDRKLADLAGIEWSGFHPEP